MSDLQISILLEAGFLLTAMGQWAKAEQIFEGLSALLPLSELPWLGLGLLCQGQDRQNHALELFRRAQRIAPRSALVRLHVAEALFQLGKVSEAEREYQIALRLAPQGSVADVAVLRMRHFSRR